MGQTQVLTTVYQTSLPQRKVVSPTSLVCLQLHLGLEQSYYVKGMRKNFPTSCRGWWHIIKFLQYFCELKMSCCRYEEQMDDYSSIMVKALADRLAEVSIMKGTQTKGLPLELLKPLVIWSAFLGCVQFPKAKISAVSKMFWFNHKFFVSHRHLQSTCTRWFAKNTGVTVVENTWMQMNFIK